MTNKNKLNLTLVKKMNEKIEDSVSVQLMIIKMIA